MWLGVINAEMVHSLGFVLQVTHATVVQTCTVCRCKWLRGVIAENRAAAGLLQRPVRVSGDHSDSILTAVWLLPERIHVNDLIA
jgi:hypothetical protein